MTWTVLSINNKGGTGKSTIAIELAQMMRDDGYDIGLMDADIDSANLASKLGCDKRVTFRGDHIIEPVEYNDMRVYSMENAFQDSAFSQSGEFFKEVIDNMVNHSDWGELDYMVVDCPPGSSDVFDELVRALRPNILGAISVGQPDAVEDTNRLVKVCNHNWVPIIGFIENMSGLVCHGEEITCNGSEEEGVLFDGSDNTGHEIYPFGEGTIEAYVEETEGMFLGRIPLVADDSDITDYDNGTIERAVRTIESADPPIIPDDNTGDPSFIKNVWNIVNDGVEEMNKQYDIEEIQNKFGVEDRDPLVMELKLTDAGPISSRVLDSIVLTVDDGNLKPLRKSKALNGGYAVEAGMEISSQDLYDSLRGEKKVMKAVTGEVTTVQYSITKAVQMGDAEVWGERTINRLAVLDKILSEVVDMGEVRQIVN